MAACKAGTMNDRKVILNIVKDSVLNPEKFLSLNKNESLKCRKSGGRFQEFLQSLSSKDLSSLWESLYSLCSVIINNLNVNLEGEERAVVEDDNNCNFFFILEGIVEWIHTYIKTEDKPVITDALLQTTQLLHDMMLSVTPKLTNSISLLCESWWACELRDKESLITNMILYVLARTFYNTAKVADIRRLWKVRGTLLLLDFEDHSADSIKELLLQTTFNHLVLSSDEGTKFITYLFGLHPSFISSIHGIIKSQLSSAPKFIVEVYGSIYHRAWRSSTGVYRDLVETQCIQDFMYMCIHADREGGSTSQFNTLRLFLDQFHQHMTQKSVQKMLYKLYRPFLRRSLKVANPYVRANATTIMLDVFPLYDPDFTKEQVNDEMQKQFDLMKELLKDPSVIVRTVSIIGVCQALSYYWEMIPPHVIKSLLTLLFFDLAFDISSSTVRVTVFHGVSILLEQRLSHVYIKELLPSLGSHLYDKVEKVRLAFLDFLILLKGMKSIKYWSVCSIDSLLVCMEEDSPVVVKRIASLLLDTFSTGTINDRLERCVVLVQSNQLSARKFYHHVLGYMTVTDLEKLIMAILKSIVHTGTNSKDNYKILGTNEDSYFSNEETVNTLLEVAVILWEGLIAKKNSAENQESLKTNVGSLFPQLSEHFQNSRSREALYMLGSFLPVTCVGTLTSGLCEIISSLHSISNSQGLILAVIKWGQEETVLELVKQGILNGLFEEKINDGKGKENRNTATATDNKRRGRSKEAVPLPLVAIDILHYIMIHPVIYNKVKKLSSFWNVMSTLHSVFDNIQHQINTATEPLEKQDFLVKCICCYIIMGAHKMIESKETQMFESQLKEVLFWCDLLLSSSYKRKSISRKRKNDQTEQCVVNHTDLLHSIIKELLSLLTDLLMSGIVHGSIENIVTDFCVKVISNVGLEPVYVLLSKLLCQLIEVTSYSHVDGIMSSLVLPACLLESILFELKHIDDTQSDSLLLKVWFSFKPVITQALVMSGYQSVLMITPSPLPVFTSLVKVILTAHVKQYQKNHSLIIPSDINELPHFVSLLVNLCCKNPNSQRLFIAHIGHNLQESENLEKLLSTLHIISSLIIRSDLKDELLHLLYTCNTCLLSMHGTEQNCNVFIHIQELSKSLLQTLTR